MIIYSTAGETAFANKRDLAFHYFDARAEVVGLTKTTGIFIHEGPTNDDEDHDDFLFRRAFINLFDDEGNMYLLPRQLDYCYDVEQYRDVLSPECADFLVKWFQAQKNLDEAFTYYVDDSINGFIYDIYLRDNALTEKYEGMGYSRMVSISIESNNTSKI